MVKAQIFPSIQFYSNDFKKTKNLAGNYSFPSHHLIYHQSPSILLQNRQHIFGSLESSVVSYRIVRLANYARTAAGFLRHRCDTLLASSDCAAKADECSIDALPLSHCLLKVVVVVESRSCQYVKLWRGKNHILTNLTGRSIFISKLASNFFIDHLLT